MTETIGASGLTVERDTPFRWCLTRGNGTRPGAVIWNDNQREFRLATSYGGAFYSAAELRDLAAFLERVNKEEGA